MENQTVPSNKQINKNAKQIYEHVCHEINEEFGGRCSLTIQSAIELLCYRLKNAKEDESPSKFINQIAHSDVVFQFDGEREVFFRLADYIIDETHNNKAMLSEIHNLALRHGDRIRTAIADLFIWPYALVELHHNCD